MYNLAIIGCGRISYKHVQAVLENIPDIQIIACADVIEERAERRAQEYFSIAEGKLANTKKPKVYNDYEKMLENEHIDIVSVCTESGYHAQIAINCMRRGKHVIVEKPMALSTADADTMIRVAKDNNVKLAVSHQNRFNPPIQRLHEAVERGRFGKIIAGNARILWNRDIDYYQQAPWRGTYELDGGCLMNQCIHNIDLLQWLLGGKIEWVHGDVSNNIHPYIEAEDYGTIQVKFESGAIGNVEGTVCIYPKNLEETLTIIGESGIVVIGGLAVNKVENWKFADNLDDEDEVIKTCNSEIDNVYGNGHIRLYEDMTEAINEDREPYINGESGKKAMEIVLAAYRSSEEAKRIKFPLSEDIEATTFRR